MRPTVFLAALAILGITASTSCSNQIASANQDKASSQIVSVDISDYPVENVSDTEQAGLVYMREEEKLARDVYIALYSKWGQRVFDNISRSEQMHMDAIKLLLDRYQIADPVGDNGPGVFSNQDLQKLYDDLIVAGSDSLISALRVGAAIEEIDIRDLQNEIDGNSDNQDIAYVYSRLMQGSHNHLRAFVKNLDRNSVTYVPQYLSEEVYLSIIDAEMERCH